jgi:hypothetical protein
MFGVKKSRPDFDIDDFKTLVRIGEDLCVGLKPTTAVGLRSRSC